MDCTHCEASGKIPYIVDGYHERLGTCEACRGSGSINEDDGCTAWAIPYTNGRCECDQCR